MENQATHYLGDIPIWKDGRVFRRQDGKPISFKQAADLRPAEPRDGIVQLYPQARTVKLKPAHLAVALQALVKSFAQDIYGNSAVMRTPGVVHLSIPKPERDGGGCIHYELSFADTIPWDVLVLGE